MTDEPALIFGDLLRSSRLARGMTQEDLAAQAELSVRGLGALERGERSRPQRQTAILLADALQLHGDARDRFLSAAQGRNGLATPHSAASQPGRGVSEKHRVVWRPRTLLVAVLASLCTAIGVLVLEARTGASQSAQSVALPHLPVDGGTRQHAVSLTRPSGIHVDAAGNLYISDQSCPVGAFCLDKRADRLLEISREGELLASWSGPQAWGGPEGIGVTPHGDLVVANVHLGTVVDVAPTGHVRLSWQPRGVAGRFAPTHVAVDQHGHIWVTDTANQRVIEFSSIGAVLRQWKRNGGARATGWYPSGIGVARDGTVYVSDSVNDRVERFTRQGRLLSWWGAEGAKPGRFRDPLDLTIDRAGDVYVADSGNNRVQTFSPTGRLLGVWGRRGAGAGEFEAPGAITVDRQGMVYVADSGNHRVQELTPAGRPVAQWGRPVHIVRLCASAPVSVAPEDSKGMFEGIRLATEAWSQRMASIGVKLLPPVLLDDSRKQQEDPAGVRRHARYCITRNDVLAYMAPIDSTGAALAEPILNRGAMAMVSSDNTDPTLTDPHLRDSLEPATQAHRIPSVTYFRIAPPDSAQGPAAASFLRRRLGAKTFVVVDDLTPYNLMLSRGMRRTASGVLGMQMLGSGSIHANDTASLVQSSKRLATMVLAEHPDAIYCGCSNETALPFLRDLATGGYTGAIVGSDELRWPLDTPRHANLPKQMYVTWPGPDPGQTSYDASAYDAAGIALQAIYGATRDGGLLQSVDALRQAVLTRVARSQYSGVTGNIQFDQNGDNVNAVISIYRLESGRWRYATRAQP